MAGSRYHKIGSIFTRTTGLLRAGAMNVNEKPMWYDVYEAFPPKVEPIYDRPEPTTSIRTILYPEDIIRAKFYTKFDYVGLINMSESSRPTICQLFIDEYMKQKKETNLSGDELWDEVAASIESRGIRLQKKTPVEAEAPTPDEADVPRIKIKISDYLVKQTQELEKN